jgi:hypothetical protein
MSHIFIVVGPTSLCVQSRTSLITMVPAEYRDECHGPTTLTKQINNDAACLYHLRASIPTLTNPVLALALLNVHYTFHTHAVFSNIQAARSSLPFIPDHLLPHVDINCADAAGPYFISVVNIIKVRREESLRSFLLRMQGGQDELTRHTNAPLMEIMKDLNEDGSGLGEYNTRPSSTAVFQPGSRVGRHDCRSESVQEYTASAVLHGLTWVLGLERVWGGEGGTTCVLRVCMGDANMRRDEAEKMVSDLGRPLLRWRREEVRRRRWVALRSA